VAFLQDVSVGKFDLRFSPTITNNIFTLKEYISAAIPIGRQQQIKFSNDNAR